jgi:hypothetical protein
MTKVAVDDTTPASAGALPAFKTIIFLPGAAPGLAVDGVPRSEGWVGQCPADEADDLCGRRLAICLSDDFPSLRPPTDGEPLPAYIARAVDRHQSVLAIMRLGEPVGLKAPIGKSLRPAEMTIHRWEREFPADHRFPWDHYRQTVLFHFSKYLRRRLLVELFDRIRAGTWCLNGHIADDVEYASHPVPAGRFGHPDMVLHYGPQGDWLRPMQRPGWPVPVASLPSFGGLTLHPRPAAPNLHGASAPGQKTALTAAAKDISSADTGIPGKKALPRFDARKAKALLLAKKVGGDWPDPPTEAETRTFLLLHFRGVSNDVHGAIRREVWPGIHRGRRPNTPR